MNFSNFNDVEDSLHEAVGQRRQNENLRWIALLLMALLPLGNLFCDPRPI